MTYRTVYKTDDGTVRDRIRDHPVRHSHDGQRMCRQCRVVDAWTEPVAPASDGSGR